jgi:drug/metabolite transporter (DMT)-like permease
VARYQQALDAVAQWGDARRQRIDESTKGIPELLWAALLLGGFVTIGFAFLFGIKSTVAHAVIMFFLTLLVAALLLVVFEFNEPFAGVVRVTPGAFQLALARMAQIP